MRSYFVTATGTDIGKTYVSARLISAWRAQGYVAQATKPVMSGFAEDALEQSDAGRLLTAMGRAVTPASVAEICLHRLAPPLSPNVAMRQAGVRQDYPEILAFVRDRLSDGGDCHLVEGAGGVMSPLTDEKLQIDLMADLQLPIILITAAYLGSVSHTLTALYALSARGLKVSAVAISQPFSSGDDLSAFAGELNRFRDVPVFGIPHGHDAAALGTALLQQDA
ncbi:dethiobiotin synthase [Hyphomonas neptunium ATCC 15444]|uniref:ATP-dependent dethiobiotin synthetase BioD n=2 Tax=Hyphomonas TaxID=85 RepID=Q0C2S6_HYPNA|nr:MULTISPECIES: dethiobiotin synthase [Hyphomonas]ABI75828.1 dethiobiotin synthase [Hyphomonas neptunium ATCC 15444]KCZ95797.1 dethiobiotin synthase [Hyphomonas hirschiana VP5]